MKSALKLDAVDLRILEAVQENARITKIALAEKVGLSPTPCAYRFSQNCSHRAYHGADYARQSSSE